MQSGDPLGSTSALYFNPRLEARLAAVRESPMVVFEAPMGYGKTVTVREFLRGAELRAVWTTALEAGPDLFWRDFCRNLARTFPKRKKTIAALERLGYPYDAVQTNEAYGLVLELDFPERAALVVDDFHLLPVSEERIPAGMGGLCELLARQGDEGPRLVLASRNRYPGNRDLLMLKNILATVERDVLALDGNDIREYFRLCGVQLNEREIRQLSERTSGWISALYLSLLHYKKHGVIAEPKALDRLVEREVFESMPDEALDLLLRLYPLERFTRAQADVLCREGDAGALLDTLERANSFLRRDENDGAYALHAIARNCLGRHFAELPPERRSELLSACGECAMADDDDMAAIRLFHEAGRPEHALDALEKCLFNSMLIKDMELVNAVFDACPPATLEARLPVSFVHATLAVTAGDFETFGRKMAWLAERCAAMPEGDPEADAWRGELELLASLAKFNDVPAMSVHHRRANELMRGRTTRLFPPDSSWTLGSPSILFMYHREAGGLDRELEIMRECMPHYYRLAADHGFGAELIMEAEALHCRGDFDAAAVAERRAAAACRAKDQLGNLLVCLFLRLRLALAGGDFPTARELIADMRSKVRDKDEYYFLHTVDLCEGHLFAAIGVPGNIAEWIKRDVGGEDRLFFFASGYYYIVHGAALAAEGRWVEIAGLFSWLLESGTHAQNLLTAIYARVYLAAAHHALGRATEAEEALRLAGAAAFPDGIIMPFVDNWRHIAPLAAKTLTDAPGTLFKTAATWEKRRNGILARYFSPERAPLNDRELKLARLAVSGKKYRDIAREVHLAHGTVKRAFATIYGKLGISSVQELRVYMKSHYVD